MTCALWWGKVGIGEQSLSLRSGSGSGPPPLTPDGVGELLYFEEGLIICAVLGDIGHVRLAYVHRAWKPRWHELGRGTCYSRR